MYSAFACLAQVLSSLSSLYSFYCCFSSNYWRYFIDECHWYLKDRKLHESIRLHSRMYLRYYLLLLQGKFAGCSRHVLLLFRIAEGILVFLVVNS